MTELSDLLAAFCRGEAPRSIRYFPEYDNVPVEQRGTNLDFIFRVYVVASEMLVKNKLHESSIHHTQEDLQVIFNAYCAGAAASKSGVFLNSAIEAMKALPEAMGAVVRSLHQRKVIAKNNFVKIAELLLQKSKDNEIPFVEIVSERMRFIGLRKRRDKWEDDALLSDLRTQGILNFLRNMRDVLDGRGPSKSIVDIARMKAADDYSVDGEAAINPKGGKMDRLRKPFEPT